MAFSCGCEIELGIELRGTILLGGVEAAWRRGKEFRNLGVDVAL